jgi:hypothetical protein
VEGQRHGEAQEEQSVVIVSIRGAARHGERDALLETARVARQYNVPGCVATVARRRNYSSTPRALAEGECY